MPNNEMRLISNDIPRIGSALQFKFFHSVGLKMAEFLEGDFSA